VLKKNPIKREERKAQDEMADPKSAAKVTGVEAGGRNMSEWGTAR
jgi:hypothetical protein